MTGFISVNNCPALTTLTTPNVTNVDQDIRASNCTNLTALSFPSLVHVGGEIDFDGSGVINASFPALTDSGLVSSGKFNGSGSVALTTLTAPNLSQVVSGDCDFHGCTAMLSLSLPALALTGSFFINGCTLLGSLSLDGGLNMAGDFIANGCPALTTFSAIGWIPSPTSTISFNGDALNSSSIDTILARAVAAGMNGGTIDLSGGTNLSHASWSVGALADETTLTTNGVTVLSNP